MHKEFYVIIKLEPKLYIPMLEYSRVFLKNMSSYQCLNFFKPYLSEFKHIYHPGWYYWAADLVAFIVNDKQLQPTTFRL
jgi:hypothetical protein